MYTGVVEAVALPPGYERELPYYQGMQRELRTVQRKRGMLESELGGEL